MDSTILDVENILNKAVEYHASDIFIVAGLPVSYRVNGVIQHVDGERLMPDSTKKIMEQIYTLANDRNISTLETCGDDDFSFAIPGLSRFRKCLQTAWRTISSCSYHYI